MKNFHANPQRGFTLVELVVVIAIIAVLSTLIVVSLDNAKMTGRDARRVSDIKQLQLALKLFYNDTGYYPTAITAGRSIANGGSNYLLRVPSNPAPHADNGCADSDYVYTQLDGGERYSLSFCLGDRTDDLSGGPKTATANGILDCDDGYIPVPGSSTFETNDFCVMKFEAKCVEKDTPNVGLTSPTTSSGAYDNNGGSCDDSREIASIPTGLPIANISQTDAQAYCETAGGHLITNAEWMTIARNAEQVAANWDGGSVGSGALFGVLGDDISPDTYDPSAVGSQQDNGYKLSTGQWIWKFGNGAAEWTNDTCTGGTGIGKYDTIAGPAKWDDSSFSDYERAVAGPSDSSWNDPQNVGEYVGCQNDGNGFQRGGGTPVNPIRGMYSLDLSADGATQDPKVGFRCVK